MINSREYNNEYVKDISNQIWRIFDLFKGIIPIEDYHVMLLFLSAYRDGILDEGHDSRYDDINHSIFRSIDSSGRYYKVVEIYAPIIRYFPSDRLHEIIYLVNRLDRIELQANFPAIFDTILAKLAQTQTKNFGEFIHPNEISRFIINLADLGDDAAVYNPFAGLASFATFLKPSQRYFGQEINHKTWAIGTLRLLAYNLEHFDYQIDDSIEHWNHFGEFDLIVANPPLGIKLSRYSHKYMNSSIESFIIHSSVDQLYRSRNGQLICVLPVSFLFNENANNKRFRKELIEDNFIDTIITLPSSILVHSSIQLCIVVFKKPLDVKRIRFVDASEYVLKTADKKNKVFDDLKLYSDLTNQSENKYVRFVDIETIRNQNYNLNVSRYFVDNDFKGVILDEIVHYLLGSRGLKDNIGKYVKIRDLKNDIIEYYLDINSIDSGDIPHSGVRKIEQDCVLVALRWKTLKPTYFKYEGEAIYISSDIAAIRVDKKKVNVNYLIKELHEGYVADQLDKYRTSSIVPTLRKDDLFNIKIKLPSLEEQNKRYYLDADKYLSSKAEAFNSGYNEQIINVNDENSFLRHQIAGSLKNVRGSFKFIQRILKNKVDPKFPGLYDLTASDELETTLLKYLNIVERDLNSISNSVNRISAKIELMDLNVESFDLLAFLREYVESVKIRAKNFYIVSLDLDEDAIKQDGFIGVYIKGDKDILSKAFDNIIENAERHAFTHGLNNGDQNKIKIELIYDFTDFTVQIDFSNTGNPLPETITLDSMIRKGSSSGNNSGDGIGLWFVNDVMKIHKGRFSFTDETGSEGINGEYITTMELTFPITPSL